MQDVNLSLNQSENFFRVFFQSSMTAPHSPTINNQNLKKGDRKTQFTLNKQLKPVSRKITNSNHFDPCKSLPSF